MSRVQVCTTGYKLDAQILAQICKQEHIHIKIS